MPPINAASDDMPLPDSEFHLQQDDADGAPESGAGQGEEDAPEEVGGEEERAVESAP